MNPNISFFTSAWAKGKPIQILELLEQIRTGKWSDKITKLRSIHDKDKADAFKKSLPAFTPSALTNGSHKGVDVIEHSGLLQGDVDEIGAEAAEDTREALREEPSVFASWISPRGNGVKLLIRIPADAKSHAAAFLTAERHFLERWNVTLDPSCKDISRLCFVSADPGLWVNEDAEILALDPPAEPAGRNYDLHEQTPPPHYSSESESVSVSTSQGKPKHQFETQQLAKKYQELVRCRVGEVRTSTRNAHLVHLVPFLFTAVGEATVRLFVEEFHREHEAIFHDSIQQTRKELESLLAGVARSYIQNLPPEALAEYYPLTPLEKVAFRICRALSQLDSEEFPAGEFFLSCADLGTRAGIPCETASRLLKAFVSKDIIAMKIKGKPRKKGEAGIATVYRFLLP